MPDFAIFFFVSNIQYPILLLCHTQYFCINCNQICIIGRMHLNVLDDNDDAFRFHFQVLLAKVGVNSGAAGFKNRVLLA